MAAATTGMARDTLTTTTSDEEKDTGRTPIPEMRSGWGASDDVDGLPCPRLYAHMAPMWPNLTIAQQRVIVQQEADYRRIMTNLTGRPPTENEDNAQRSNPHDLHVSPHACTPPAISLSTNRRPPNMVGQY